MAVLRIHTGAHGACGMHACKDMEKAEVPDWSGRETKGSEKWEAEERDGRCQGGEEPREKWLARWWAHGQLPAGSTEENYLSTLRGKDAPSEHAQSHSF